MKTVALEILQPCGDWTTGQRVRTDPKRAAKLQRTGYARVIEEPNREEATVQPAETAEARPPVRQTRRVEQRG